MFNEEFSASDVGGQCFMNKRRRHLIDFIDEAMIPHLIERLRNI